MDPQTPFQDCMVEEEIRRWDEHPRIPQQTLCAGGTSVQAGELLLPENPFGRTIFDDSKACAHDFLRHQIR